MKLAEFISLSEQEKKLETELVALAYNSPEDKTPLLEKILECKEDSLFKIALQNPRVDRLLQSTDLNKYWNDLWRRAGVNPAGCQHNSAKPLHEYQPMATISSFNLLKSLFVYEGYRKLINTEKMSQALINNAAEYLVLAAKSGCFFAMNALCENGLKLLKERFDEKLVQIILYSAQSASKLYWTPGYLLLANVYKELNQYKDQGLLLRSMHLSLMAFESLVIAQTLESMSGAMINNAYQGKSLKTASGDKSFSQIKMKFISDLNLSSGSQTLAARRVGVVISDIKKQFPVSEILDGDELDSGDPDINLIPMF